MASLLGGAIASDAAAIVQSERRLAVRSSPNWRLPHGDERSRLHRHVRARLPRTNRYVMLAGKDLPHPIARYETQIAR